MTRPHRDLALSPAVRAVCEQHDGAIDLVMATIYSFIDVSPRCSLMTAALSGHMHLVQRLSARHPQPFDACCEEAMDSAAEFGHLDVVQWLHTNRSEGCTTDAMDMAAGNGYLDVVQWLHDYRSEGCTTNAMDFAAQNGHVHVLEWLHANRTEGCTHLAMDNAATSGHLHVMQWLHIHRHEGCSKSALVNACFSGHYNIALWLLAYRRKDCRKEDVLTTRAGRDEWLRKWQQEQQLQQYSEEHRSDHSGVCTQDASRRSPKRRRSIVLLDSGASQSDTDKLAQALLM